MLSKDRRAMNPSPVFGFLATFDVLVPCSGAGKRELQAASNTMQAIVGSSIVSFRIGFPQNVP
jgi:hypothetical protein